MSLLLLSACVPSWHGLAARVSTPGRYGMASMTSIDELLGSGPETGAAQPWDPLKLGTSDWGTSDEFDRLGWFRHAEIKHGRVAMAAFVGYLFTANGIFFPGDLQLDGTQFSDLGKDPIDAWFALSDQGRQSIIGTIGILELLSEAGVGLDDKTHYAKGGEPGRAPISFKLFFWNKVDSMSPEEKQTKLLSELKNGRLAMVGIASLYAAASIKGSVPLLAGVFDGLNGGQIGILFPGYSP